MQIFTQALAREQHHDVRIMEPRFPFVVEQAPSSSQVSTSSRRRNMNVFILFIVSLEMSLVPLGAVFFRLRFWGSNL